MPLLHPNQEAPGESEILACGGTRRSFDADAPREIRSEKMILFSATSVLPEMRDDPSSRLKDREIAYVSAFAAPTEKGSFLVLATRERPFSREKKQFDWALVRADVFPGLVELVREEKLASHNGEHSFTYGLPYDFGGSVSIDYQSGERISFANNQGPIFSRKTGCRIAAFFAEAMHGEPVPLPDRKELTSIRFDETTSSGGFTRATLTVRPDGSAHIRRSCRYSDPMVYESEKTLSAAEFTALTDAVEEGGMLAWSTLPKRRTALENDRVLTFVFADGSEIPVRDDRALPEVLSGYFFQVSFALARN